MAITKSPQPMSDGTVFGVPFRFHIERYVYELPDGKEFDYNNYDKMYQYVENNKSKYILDQIRARRIAVEIQELQRGHADIQPTLIMQRAELTDRNRRAQFTWDKEFNFRVLNLVRKVIEQGSVHVAKMEPIKMYDPVSDAKINKMVEEHIIVYPRHMESNAAYMYVREQAEKIVKTLMPPSDLIEFP
jgi:hypothetical protein